MNSKKKCKCKCKNKNKSKGQINKINKKVLKYE